MKNAEDANATCVCDSAWCFATHLYDQGGGAILAFLFIAIMFYKLIWKVWTVAMTTRDNEIARLTQERNFLQSRLVPDLLTSDRQKRK